MIGLGPSSADILGPYGGCEYSEATGNPAMYPMGTASQFWGCGAPGSNANDVAKLGEEKFTTDTGCGNLAVYDLH